jgi:hypothetical protein
MEPTCGGPTTRNLTYLGVDNDMTLQRCLNLAADASFTYFAVQYGLQCFGGWADVPQQCHRQQQQQGWTCSNLTSCSSLVVGGFIDAFFYQDVPRQ